MSKYRFFKYQEKPLVYAVSYSNKTEPIVLIVKDRDSRLIWCDYKCTQFKNPFDLSKAIFQAAASAEAEYLDAHKDE